MLESANKEEYTFQVDIYSYAILLYRIITRLIPFIGYDLGAKINAAVICWGASAVETRSGSDFRLSDAYRAYALMLVG